MEKKMFEVGETFQCGMVNLRVEKSDGSCKDCFFAKNTKCLGIVMQLKECERNRPIEMMVGNCDRIHRIDKTDVIFVKVEE